MVWQTINGLHWKRKTTWRNNSRRELRCGMTVGILTNRNSRSAFTLIEVIVVLTILAVVVGVIIPAVLNVRATARKIACANNFKQIGVSLLEYEAARQRYPGNFMGIVEDKASNNKRTLWSFSPSGLIASSLGSSASDNLPVARPASQPFDPDYKKIKIPAPKVLFCPDDPQVTDRDTNYRYCRGVLPVWPGDPRGTFIGFHGIRPMQIIDGLSNTAFASERLVSKAEGPKQTSRDIIGLPTSLNKPITEACKEANSTGDWNWYSKSSGESWLSGRWLNSSYYHFYPPNSRAMDCAQETSLQTAIVSARSNHNGGVWVLLGDGHVSFTSNSISLPVWHALSTRNGKDHTRSE